jgi:hypothetical protein
VTPAVGRTDPPSSGAGSLGLVQLIERLCSAADDAEQDHVTIGVLMEAIGRRSFGALLLVPGLLMIVGIPVFASVCGFVAALISVQILFGRRSFWLPGWALRRGIPRRHFQHGLRFLRRPARFVDRLLRPRLTTLVHGRALPAIATMCAMMGLLTPAVEVIPMADSVVGAGLSAFALALIAEDGVVALVAFVLYLAALMLAAFGMMGLITGGSFFSNGLF